MRIYVIGFKSLIVQKLRRKLRSRFNVSWLLALTSPVSWIHNNFLSYRNDAIYRLTITPQVCFLERLLNDRYDVLERRIYITRALQKEVTYLFTDEESKPVFVCEEIEQNPIFFYADSETALVGVDFVVMVPYTVPINEAEFNALLEVYKLPDKSHTLQRF